MAEEKGNMPALNIWFVPEREGAKWIQIGAVWPNKEEGFSGSLEVAAPGRIVLLPPKAKADDEQS